MFINEVIDHVRSVYPTEYDDYEMYLWCDEVSSMLAMEDRNMYELLMLPILDEGEILLPEGVDIENIEYIMVGGKELNKRDLRMYGGRRVYVKGKNGAFLPNEVSEAMYAGVVYLKPYSPIRLTAYLGGITIDKDRGSFTIGSREFEPGDNVDIILSPDASSKTKFDAVPVFSVEYTDEGWLYTVPKDLFSDVTVTDNMTAKMVRKVTERTLCGPPFDTMYVDYLLAKIMLCQHDSESANIHLTLFNSRLAAYKNWVIKRMPSGDCTFRNWW